ncbi:SGNH/GDSL hydrolase family protein [Actinomadura sp. SCN-SB]|uniref:SGNH/GDSL hydrolase family protein n=1 Tax=Actinomadura sp. SCN-SB TaxID=3373092 RepID=UPI0037502B72
MRPLSFTRATRTTNGDATIGAHGSALSNGARNGNGHGGSTGTVNVNGSSERVATASPSSSASSSSKAPQGRTARAFTAVPRAAMSVLFAPVLMIQARRTVRRTPRLHPAAGAHQGTVPGSVPLVRLLVIGESTAAGVGASDHTEALPGFLSGCLRELHHCGVTWSVAGKNGATARRVFREVVPSLNGFNPDIVVITIGINDLMHRRPLRSWSLDLTALVAALRGRYEKAQVILAGMPPVHRFPALPQPLRTVMGGRAKSMDRIMQEVARAYGAVHVPMDADMAADPRMFASDGFHPSPVGYRAWAEDLARAVRFPTGPDRIRVNGNGNGSRNGNGRAPVRGVVASAAAVEVREPPS